MIFPLMQNSECTNVLWIYNITDSWTHDSYESVLFSESKTCSATSVVRVLNDSCEPVLSAIQTHFWISTSCYWIYPDAWLLLSSCSARNEPSCYVLMLVRLKTVSLLTECHEMYIQIRIMSYCTQSDGYFIRNKSILNEMSPHAASEKSMKSIACANPSFKRTEINVFSYLLYRFWNSWFGNRLLRAVNAKRIAVSREIFFPQSLMETLMIRDRYAQWTSQQKSLNARP